MRTQPRSTRGSRQAIEITWSAAQPRYATSYFSSAVSGAASGFAAKASPENTEICMPTKLPRCLSDGNIHGLLCVWLIFTYNTHPDIQRYNLICIDLRGGADTLDGSRS